MTDGKKISKSCGQSMSTVFIVLLILKLTDTGKVADWPWVYVCMPLIIQAGLFALIFICAGVAFCAARDQPRELPI